MEKDLIIDGLRIHYDETGPEHGAPVIIMHGWGCDHSTVRSIAALLEKGMHVYNIDLPGHGRSDEPPATWGVDEYTKLVEDFCSRLEISNPSLIGHSFGGRIGLLMASRNPVRKMILVDAAGIKPRRKPKYYFKVYSFKIAKKLLPLILGEKRGKSAIDRWRGKAGSADYRNSSPVMRAVMSRCVNQDLKHVMPDIKASTLLVWGENDTATPIADANYMEKNIPDAGLVAFPDAGHYSFLDNPGGFAAVTREFFKRELAPKQS
ncbi:MAG: alpha/beta hydrolase [Muribaculaceae bacterium]|nr:alpha/beta hydrolase [Muribaculaceae bacterium]